MAESNSWVPATPEMQKLQLELDCLVEKVLMQVAVDSLRERIDDLAAAEAERIDAANTEFFRRARSHNAWYLK